MPQVAQPNLDYLAPENLTGAVTSASDMFSLGLLIYAVYNDGNTIISYNDDYNIYKKRVNEVSFYLLKVFKMSFATSYIKVVLL